MKGKLIVIEGIDGSGKSTCAKNLAEKLNSINIKTIYKKVWKIAENPVKTWKNGFSRVKKGIYIYFFGDKFCQSAVPVITKDVSEVVLAYIVPDTPGIFFSTYPIVFLQNFSFFSKSV